MSSPMEVNLVERGFIRSWIKPKDIDQIRTFFFYFLCIRRKTKDKQHIVIFFLSLAESFKYFVNKTGVPDGLDLMADLRVWHTSNSPICPAQAENKELR